MRLRALLQKIDRYTLDVFNPPRALAPRRPVRR